MTDFAPLDAALKIAGEKGRVIPFWWRDDDAIAPSSALNTLIALSRRHNVPLALAAIPASAQAKLVQSLAGASDVSILVHGFSHANHAPEGVKKAEFGDHRPIEKMIAEAGQSLRLLQSLFPADILTPIFVPPWNRIAPALSAALPAAGYRGLSTFGDRKAPEAAPGLIQINTHIDPIDWHGSRSLADSAAMIGNLAETVMRRIRGETDEPVGLLTHHLAHDEPVWNFCEELIVRLRASPAVKFADIRAVLAEETKHVTRSF